jgi:hypothetical protein
MTMKLGLAIGYSGAHLDVPVALVQRAEELGYNSVWSAHRRTLPRLGGQRREFAQRAIGPTRGHRGDGQGRAAELSRERADRPRARDAGTLRDLFRERATPVALPANILTSGE